MISCDLLATAGRSTPKSNVIEGASAPIRSSRGMNYLVLGWRGLVSRVGVHVARC